MSAEIPPLVRGGSGLKARGGLWGECLAEFLGTFVLLMFGLGSVAMAVVALPGSGRTQGPTTFFLGSGDWLLIAWGWALAVTFGVYVAGGVSGAHLNPAVTLAFAVRRGFQWNKVVPYMIAQLLGAFAGAAVVLLVYKDAIKAFENASKPAGHNLATFSIFGTFPAPYFAGSIWGPLIDQIVGTAMLLILIAAVVDLRNKAALANLGPLVIGFAVAAIGMSFGANAGYAINPARDLGPRLLAWVAGWGDFALPGNGAWFSGYWWIPIIGPFIGAVVGILIYDLFISDVLIARAGGGPVPEVTYVEDVPPGPGEPEGIVPPTSGEELPPATRGRRSQQ
jgi:glycerol uptake facilitator protein